MAHLIDKSALVAEIRKHLEYANNGILYAQTGIEKGLKKYERDLNVWQHCQSMCKNILSLIDTLEVKEVELDTEIMKYQREIYDRDTTVRDVAKYFFELGLKAQKEEKV